MLVEEVLKHSWDNAVAQHRCMTERESHAAAYIALQSAYPAEAVRVIQGTDEGLFLALLYSSYWPVQTGVWRISL